MGEVQTKMKLSELVSKTRATTYATKEDAMIASGLAALSIRAACGREEAMEKTEAVFQAWKDENAQKLIDSGLGDAPIAALRLAFWGGWKGATNYIATGQFI